MRVVPVVTPETLNFSIFVASVPSLMDVLPAPRLTVAAVAVIVPVAVRVLETVVAPDIVVAPERVAAPEIVVVLEIVVAPERVVAPESVEAPDADNVPATASVLPAPTFRPTDVPVPSDLKMPSSVSRPSFRWPPQASVSAPTSGFVRFRFAVYELGIVTSAPVGLQSLVGLPGRVARKRYPCPRMRPRRAAAKVAEKLCYIT